MNIPLYQIVQTRLVPRTSANLWPGEELQEYVCDNNRYPELVGR